MIIHIAANMRVNKDKDHGGAVSVEIAKQISRSYIGHDVLNRSERSFHVWGIVHRQKDPGNELKCKEQPRQRTEASVIVEIARGGVVEEVV